MIFAAAGTQDGRELIAYLLERGYDVVASVVSDYGKSLLPKHERLKVNAAPLDKEQLKNYLQTHDITAVVDASHPYAVQISASAMECCRELNLPYIRYERPTEPADYEKIYPAPSYEAAAQLAAQQAAGGTVFLTTGSRSLPIFCRHPSLKENRIVARVLPTAAVISECEKLGLSPKDIVAMQGPFSVELNTALFRAYDARVIVTKDTAHLGGADTKIEAAKLLSFPVVMVERPPISYDNVATDFMAVENFLAAKEL